jgi:hypothetical protein
MSAHRVSDRRRVNTIGVGRWFIGRIAIPVRNATARVGSDRTAG